MVNFPIAAVRWPSAHMVSSLVGCFDTQCIAIKIQWWATLKYLLLCTGAAADQRRLSYLMSLPIHVCGAQVCNASRQVYSVLCSGAARLGYVHAGRDSINPATRLNDEPFKNETEQKATQWASAKASPPSRQQTFGSTFFEWNTHDGESNEVSSLSLHNVSLAQWVTRLCAMHGALPIPRFAASHFKTAVHVYTLWVKKYWATILRPITLEILNRSLPNWAQIAFSSCWTSCHNLFESTLENSGAIWRITSTINKKVIKVMNWQRMRHAVVSARLLTIALLILSTKEKPGWW